MKRQRVVTYLLAIACLIMAGVTLHEFRVPLVSPASAQDDGTSDSSPSPNFGPMQAASPAVRKAAAAAIRAQLQAFQKDDYQTAVKFQSSNLRRNFQSVAQFRRMITSTYPEFAHYKSVQFKDIRADAKGQHAVAQVILTGQDGVTINAVYLLVRESTGYKIDGVGGGSRPPLKAAPGVSIDA